MPVGHRLRGAMMQSLYKTQGVPRMLAPRLFEETLDERLGRALGYLFERVASNDDGGVQPTYDLSVPDNVTYVANGMVSHNTIGLMMDCDTTGDRAGPGPGEVQEAGRRRAPCRSSTRPCPGP